MAVLAGRGKSLGARWPLIGREAELALLESALGLDQNVVVSGSAGVGKTRMVAHFAEASGRKVFHVTATAAAAAVPLGALAPLLPDGVAAVAVASTLRTMFQAQPGVLLVVDDAHLLDAVSAAVVHQLSTAGITVLATIRSGEPAPDAITALWKSDDGQLLQLRPLTHSQITLLLERVLDGQVDTGAVHQLATQSAGNPLFLRELVKSALDGEVLVRRHGLWLLASELPYEDRLADLLPVRVEALSPVTRRLTELVALAEPLPLDTLLALGAADEVEAAEERGVVVVRAEGTGHAARLAHPLYGDAVRSSLTQTRRLRLLGELADAFGTATGEVARLRRGLFELEAGRHPEQGYLLELSQLARPLDPALALRFARASYDAGGGVPAALALADLLAFAQRHEEMDELLAKVNVATLHPAERITVAATRAFSLSFAANRPEAALAVLDDLADLGPVPPLQAARALALMRLGRMEQALALAEPIAHDPGMPPVLRMHAAFSSLAALAMSGRTARASALIATAKELLPMAVGVMPQASDTLCLLDGLVKGVAGEIAGERAIAQEGYARCLESGAIGERLQYAQVLGRLAILAGQPRSGVRLLRETLAGEGLWWAATLPWTITLLAQALAMAGDCAQANLVMGELDGRPVAGYYEPFIGLTVAEIEAAQGAVSAATARAWQAAQLAESLGQDWIAIQGFNSLIRYGDTAATPHVESLAARIDGAFPQAMVRFAQGRAGDNGAELERAAIMFGHIGAHVFRAEAQACAVRAYRASGRPGLAGVAAERLRSILAGLEPLSTLALMGVDQLETLTSREAEVARLAANGYTDREIASRLLISVRTAQTHLTRVYAKLGITGRRDLAQELRGVDSQT